MNAMARGLGWMAVVLTVLLAASAGANNVTVTNVVLTPAGGTAQVKFDLSWDNSWRDLINHDACWLFVKYSTDSGASWAHATLSATGTNPPSFSAGTDANLELIVPSDKKGAFIRRTAAAGIWSGSIATTNVSVMWDFATDGVSPSAQALVQVFAIELVYVPGGSFKLGGIGTEQNHFYQVAADASTTNPYPVTSEASILVSNSVGCLWATGDISTGTLSNAFPKGYAPFYIQKMATSRRQFTDFINTLTAAQQNRHTYSEYTSLKTDNAIKGTADPATGTRGFFGTDYNGNAGGSLAATQSSLNETNDGEWFQVTSTTWPTDKAYIDWAAMRPATELEWEKALRGPLDPVANVYPWNTINVVDNGNNYSNRQTRTEIPLVGNTSWNNASIRVGCFARSGSTREQAGAGYYGVLDPLCRMGNALVSANAGKSFSAVNGDGALDVNGFSDAAGWPGSAANRSTVYDGSSSANWPMAARATNGGNGAGIPRVARSAP